MPAASPAIGTAHSFLGTVLHHKEEELGAVEVEVEVEGQLLYRSSAATILVDSHITSR